MNVGSNPHKRPSLKPKLIQSSWQDKMYSKLFKRSFRKHEPPKKVFTWAFFGCFVMATSFCAMLNSYMTPLSLLKFQQTVSSSSSSNSLNVNESRISGKSVDWDIGHETPQVEKVIIQEQMKSFNPIPATKISNSIPAMKISNLIPATKISNPIPATKISNPIPATKISNPIPATKISNPIPSAFCDFSLPRSEFCEINGNARIHGNSSSIYIPPPLLNNANVTWKLRVYARKVDRTIMKKSRVLTLGPPSSFGLSEMPPCSINHKIPGIVFSVGGYTGNYFHSLTDVLVPLYATSRPFNGEVQFLVTNMKLHWVKKYNALLSSLTNYPIIDIDNSKEVHCFPRLLVGLKSHKEFSIEPSRTPQGYSMRNFTQFARSAYSLKRNNVKKPIKKPPRLLIISRKGSRTFLNANEVAKEARKLGFNVVILEASWHLEEFSKIVNSFDVMLGVHGAGLTNSIFLPENAVVIQVVPIGLEWLARYDFELPSNDMNLRYLEYKIGATESSLGDKYSLDDPMIRNPSVKGGDWDAFKKAYLEGQNVRIDVRRFRATLLKARQLLQH